MLWRTRSQGLQHFLPSTDHLGTRISLQQNQKRQTKALRITDMVVYGKIEEFDAPREKWSHYSERLAQYFLANDKKRAILLSVIGPTTYSLLRSVLSPNKPFDLSYDEISKALQNHCNPKPLPIVQRFKFYHCVDTPGQSIASFASNLREISETCQFGPVLEEMLRDFETCHVGK